ncbi:RNA methyltransferase [Sphingobacteriales bacterium UPWRP_1]|nr:RNA methyltransferase [Sphingobacteriales bacterium TSM_CSS]PSJ78368.1 RNA methyltransferase [Sphingobacteriales bacterium UPWRP_1]
MAYNQLLANRVRQYLMNLPHIEEKAMMGGLTFMVNHKMCVGILQDDLMARIDPAVYETVLEQEGCREMNFTKKPMKGFVFVAPEGTDTDAKLHYWLNLALEFNPKAKAAGAKKTKKNR